MELVKQLREGAEQMREDAEHCWGIRRKLNLLSAARLMDRAADQITGEAPRKRLRDLLGTRRIKA